MAQQNPLYRPDQFLNPGPAPRPPTDRPKVALTPQVYHTTGNPNLGSFNSLSNSSVSSTDLKSTPTLGRSDTGNGEFTVVKDGWAKVKRRAVDS